MMWSRKWMLVVGCLLPLAAAGQDLSGFWKHEEQPAWIEVRFENGVGTGTVVRNDEYPDRVGRVLLKDLSADPEEQGSWRGQVYAQRLEEYRDAQVTLPEAELMRIKVKVGFISRTVQWTRAAALPE